MGRRGGSRRQEADHLVVHGGERAAESCIRLLVELHDGRHRARGDRRDGSELSCGKELSKRKHYYNAYIPFCVLITVSIQKGPLRFDQSSDGILVHLVVVGHWIDYRTVYWRHPESAGAQVSVALLAGRFVRQLPLRASSDGNRRRFRCAVTLCQTPN